MEYFKTGDQVDFTKGSMKNNPKYAELGVCNIGSITMARVWYHVEMVPVAGPRAGKVVTWKVRSLDRFGEIAPLVKKASKKTVEQVQEAFSAKYEDRSKKFDRTASLKIEGGDIVEVTDTRNGSKTTFRVYEVDFQKNRIKGWPEGRWSSQVGARMGYYSTAHDNVYTFKIVEKAAFVVATDSLYIAHKEQTANAGAKRAKTRARKDELRNMFGW